jgi:hypothetical protein
MDTLFIKADHAFIAQKMVAQFTQIDQTTLAKCILAHGLMTQTSPNG